MGSKYARHRAIAKGQGGKEPDVVQLATQVQATLHHTMRVYCVQHRLAIQTFITEAIGLRLKKR